MTRITLDYSEAFQIREFMIKEWHVFICNECDHMFYHRGIWHLEEEDRTGHIPAEDYVEDGYCRDCYYSVTDEIEAREAAYYGYTPEEWSDLKFVSDREADKIRERAFERNWEK